MDAIEKLIYDEKKQVMYEEESLADLLFDDLNSGKIEVEEPKKKQYYASGMSLVEGRWQSCGWTIEADSFLEAAKIADADETFRMHSLSDNVAY